jgi:TerC family integral membrane protein
MPPPTDLLGTPVHMWTIFAIVVACALVIDLGVFHRKTHEVRLREALLESAIWIAVSLSFNLWLYLSRGGQAGIEFLTGYLVEKSLSLDNLFIFLLIFQAFRIPKRSQHKVLFYGVHGALVMRALFVIAGVGLLHKFHAILYVFGALLLATGLRMIPPKKKSVHPEQNFLVRLARRVMPVAEEYEGEKFFIKSRGKRYATTLFLALIAVEAMDLVFAVDSVPAVLAITRDTFIVYSSNVFAILGLRALYFALADLLPRFRFLRQGLGAILVFVGAKMLLSERLAVPTSLSLAFIAVILAVTIAASLMVTRRQLNMRT